MAKFSRGLLIDFFKQPRTRKSLTNPPLWCQLHKMSLSSAIIEHWAVYCCPGVIPSVCPEPFDFESVLSFYAVSDIWAWSRCCCVKHRSVGTSLCLPHKKGPLPLGNVKAFNAICVWIRQPYGRDVEADMPEQVKRFLKALRLGLSNKFSKWWRIHVTCGL